MEEQRALELWGGVECTVNRVGDKYFDQCERTGHDTRSSDLDLFADLGIRALRYPVLWERTAPDGVESADWSWADERLSRLQTLGIRPIVTLVHHGSGPRWTSLVDPKFPAGLAAFAGAVAARYPWVEDWTPVNEPLTTARFSGLYGHWYPHGSDDRVFVQALLTQCRAVVLAMRAIRAVNPRARLIQTDDIGKVWSTPALAYQAEFENARRWTSFDLLTGRVNREHPLWHYFTYAGAEEHDLAWFHENPCPPDVIGINHYLSSERFLDDRLELYPADTHGGNWLHRYADVLAARVLREGAAGPGAILREVWERYHLPIAVTEAHNGCTREEQLRWLHEVWDAARSLRADGVDLKAVTVWSLLGVHGWNNLVTRPDGIYEPGVFDVRASQPRPTALAGLMRELAAGRAPSHPLYAVAGWWRRSDRLIYGFAIDEDGTIGPPEIAPDGDTTPIVPPRPIMILGNGTLGTAFERLCAGRGLPTRRVASAEHDPRDLSSFEKLLDSTQPWAVVDTRGASMLHGAAQSTPASDRDVTTLQADVALAESCARRGTTLVRFVANQERDGHTQRAFTGRPADTARESSSLPVDPEPLGLVISTGTCFSPGDEHNSLITALTQLARGLPVVVRDDAAIALSYVPDLVHICLDLMIDGEQGLWHLSNPGSHEWAEVVRQVAALAGLDTGDILMERAVGGGSEAQSPGGEHSMLLPPLADALERFVHDLPRERWSSDPARMRITAPVRRD
jgi:dTDP-4-dehydrorhamnose reductase